MKARLIVAVDVEGVDPTLVDPLELAEDLLVDFDGHSVRTITPESAEVVHAEWLDPQPPEFATP